MFYGTRARCISGVLCGTLAHVTSMLIVSGGTPPKNARKDGKRIWEANK